MIEVITFRTGGLVDRAEAETPEAALLAGQILYDEGLQDHYGDKLSVGFYVGGKLVRMVPGRPS